MGTESKTAYLKMKVYRISTLAKPPNTRFDTYATVLADDQAFNFINPTKEFSGAPFSKEWKKQRLYIEKPKLPRPDFFHFGISKFVCNERARGLTGEPLEMCGELLPIEIERENGDYYLYNVTNCINVVDLEKSRWQTLLYWKNSTQQKPEEKKEELKILKTPAFIAERLGEESLFKIPEDNGTEIYCLERTGDADDGEFKALVEKHGLTGLEFKLIWTEERGLEPRSYDSFLE